MKKRLQQSPARNLVSPFGRAEKPVRTARLTNQRSFYTDLLACCSFRRGLRRATFLKEEGDQKSPFTRRGIIL